jgi:hypothetical protein
VEGRREGQKEKARKFLGIFLLFELLIRLFVK